MKVSIVIPTLNSGKTIEGCLDSIERLDYPKDQLEVIVVDGGSKDNTLQVVNQYRAKVLFERYGSRGGACNVGVRNSEGDIVIFTDGDCYVPKGWIRKIVKRFQDDPELCALGGLDLNIEEGETNLGKAVGWIEIFRRLKPVQGNEATFKVKGCNSAYRKNIFLKFDGFDPALKYGEEAEFHAKLLYHGSKIIFDPQIIVYHHRHGKTIKRQFNRSIKNARYSFPILLRPWVFAAALKDPYSSIATSYYLFFGSLFAGSLLTYFYIVLRSLVIPFFLFLLFSYFILILVYSATIFFRMKDYESKTIPVVIMVDIIARTVGIYIGALGSLWNHPWW